MNCPLTKEQFEKLNPALRESTAWVWLPARAEDIDAETLQQLAGVLDQPALKTLPHHVHRCDRLRRDKAEAS